MSDYLWDRSGEPDPEVKALEERLAALRREPPRLPELPARHETLPPAWRRLFVAAPLVLAASLLLAAGLAFLDREKGWEVKWGVSADRTSRLSPGEWLETGADTARVDVGGIGTLRVGPGTRLRLVANTPEDRRVALARGTIHARIWAPPRRFFVETPAATAIDLGCAYALSTDEAGDGLLAVTSGWVSLERTSPGGVDEVAVPAGASCRVSAESGPGTPVWDDAPTSFREAHDRLEAGGGRDGESAVRLEDLLRHARPKDGLTLLALAPRLVPDERGAVYDRLAALSPAVRLLPRQPFVAGEARALDALRDALGLPTP
jgi:ferric-dicitrate binding protein FerR (iron transport regulator)